MTDFHRWYAVYTYHRHEKKVAELLRALDFEAYVPTIKAPRRWNNRRNVTLDVPIFPGYVFVGVREMNKNERTRILSISTVVSFVASAEGPIEIGEQLETVRLSVSSYRVAPHACLREGRLTSIVRGPLAGRVGILAPGEELRIVFNLDVLNAAIAVSVNPEDIE